MAVTTATFTGDGSTSDFVYGFNLEGSFNTVKVGTKTVDEPDYTLQVEGTDYLHIPATKTISFLSTSTPANGVQGLITRSTSRERTRINFIDGSTLTPDVLNNDAERSATVDEEVEDRVVQTRSSEPLVAQMPTVGTPKTLDMGIAADLLILQGKVDGTREAIYIVTVPAEGETVQTAGMAIGTGAAFAPELRFELNSDPTKIDLTMVTANGFVAWTQIKMTPLQLPITANL